MRPESWVSTSNIVIFQHLFTFQHRNMEKYPLFWTPLVQHALISLANLSFYNTMLSKRSLCKITPMQGRWKGDDWIGAVERSLMYKWCSVWTQLIETIVFYTNRVGVFIVCLCFAVFWKLLHLPEIISDESYRNDGI